MVIELGKNILTLLRFTNFSGSYSYSSSSSVVKENDDGSITKSKSIFELYSKIKEYVPFAMKSEFIQNVRDNLSHGGGSGSLALDRIKAK